MTTNFTTENTGLTIDQSDQLIERARIAFAKAGGREQLSGASDVTNVDGVITVTLRNVNGALAAYQLHGQVLKRVTDKEAVK